MAYPISSVLPRVEPQLRGWLSEARRRRIADLASALPPTWDWGCYEGRLAPGADRVDFAVRAFTDRVGKELVAEALRRGDDFPGKEEVGDFLAGWSEPGSLLHAGVPETWLEYDIPDGEVRAPFVSLSFTAGENAELAAQVPAATLRDLTREALRLLHRVPDPRRLEELVRLAETLPAAGRIVHIAPLPAWRGRQDLRVVAYMPYDEGTRWLHDIGWPGRPDQLDTAWRLVGPRQRWMHINLDLGRELRPVIGLQFDPPLTPGLRREWWWELLEPLVEQGLCCPEKARRVLDWDHQEFYRPKDAEWPVRLTRNGYAKITVDEKDRVEAKVYLCFEVRLVPWSYPEG